MRMALKPAAFTELMGCWLVAGLPQAVSLQMASSVLPRFHPRSIWLATCGAVGSVCAWAGAEREMEMAASSNANDANALRHFAAESLRSDMGSPWLIGPSMTGQRGRAPTLPLARSAAGYALQPVSLQCGLSQAGIL